MKRIASALLAPALLLGAMLPSAVSAEGKPKFEETYYPYGVDPPKPGYTYLVKKTPDGYDSAKDYLCLRFECPPQQMLYWNDKEPYEHTDFFWAFGSEFHTSAEPFFEELEVSTYSPNCFYQYDIRCNDEDWAYTEAWDEFDPETGYPNGYSVLVARPYDWRYWTPGQTWGEANDLMQSLVGEYQNQKHFDLKNNTLTFRARYVVTYREDEAHGGAEHVLFSD